MSGLNVVANIALGRFVEKIADDATKILVLLLRVVQADATLRDHDDLAAALGANTEANFTNYARKTGITATIIVDDTNDRVDVDIPDQTWLVAGGATNNGLVKLGIAYEESASDAGRVPLTWHTFDVTTDGSDLVAQIAAAGFARAS